MKTIKFLTLDSVNVLSEELGNFATESKIEISKKIADYLMTEGNTKFIELYNDFAKSKDYKNALLKLQINYGNNPNTSNKIISNSL